MKSIQISVKIIVILSLVLCLAACGKSEDKAEDETDIASGADVKTDSSEQVSVKDLSEKDDVDEKATDNKTNQSISSTNLESIPAIAPDFEYEEEPDSPLQEIAISQAEQGVSDREAIRFFKTFSTIPVYYAYTSTVLPENKSQDVIISIDEIGRTYTKIESKTDSVEIVSTSKDVYYELDRENKIAYSISKEDAQGDIISKDVFEQIYEQAELLYYVGSGKATFKNRDVEFEEYTKDNKTFVRYYFDEDSVYGHRTFENNQLKSQVVISALKNYFPDQMDIFLIPDDFTINNND
ncbi:MAG TPA: hypothetical protein GXZ43_04825 [Clostridiaceae bacterium]|nr:hypothetical protein [Clostridiaceae bacterium]